MLIGIAGGLAEADGMFTGREIFEDSDKPDRALIEYVAYVTFDILTGRAVVHLQVIGADEIAGFLLARGIKRTEDDDRAIVKRKVDFDFTTGIGQRGKGGSSTLERSPDRIETELARCRRRKRSRRWCDNR